MTIRKATEQDISILLRLADDARTIMRKSGNKDQWSNGYPSAEVFRKDIANGCSYIAEENGEATGTFAFIPSPEPTYSYIEGKWLDDNPYYVIHRIASSAKSHGLFKAMIDYCFSKTNNIRIDTHRNNIIMQRLMEKHGFIYCGIIYLANGDERLAYQKIIFAK
jgi:RimJ/RimL family protein N-acetyltransferase